MRFSFFILFIVAIQVQAQSFYKTPSGNKFHTATCRMVENVSTKVNKQEINSIGLSPCKICKPAFLGISNSFQNKAVGKSDSIRCKGYTKKGTRCKHKTRLANGYCYQHTKRGYTLSKLYLKSTNTYSSICGGRTKSGSSCRRKVKGGGRCYQHRQK